ncbi:hypothetical protein BGW80DRAFT_584702 [Lactifluus volemus]|nr:hypothetical protein BGW80DRAFT_584702 [Lactifluus volemus]
MSARRCFLFAVCGFRCVKSWKYRRIPWYRPECSKCYTVTTAKHETCNFLHQGYALDKRRSQIPHWCPSCTPRIRQGMSATDSQQDMTFSSMWTPASTMQSPLDRPHHHHSASHK